MKPQNFASIPMEMTGTILDGASVGIVKMLTYDYTNAMIKNTFCMCV
jgi:uncharacterized membrane protein